MIAALLRRSYLWHTLLIGLLALGLRIFYLHEIENSPLFQVPAADARTEVDDVLAIAAGAGQGELSSSQLYTYFLASIFRVFGEGYYLPRLFQALLGAAICIFLYSIGRAVFPSAIALGAGLAAAFYGPLIYFGGALSPAILAVFLSLLFLLSLLYSPGRGPWNWVVSGFLLGLATLAAVHVLVFLPFLIFWLFRLNRPSLAAGRQTLKQGSFLLLGGAGTMALAALHNHLTGHDFALLSHHVGFGLSALKPLGWLHHLYFSLHGAEHLPDLDPYYARRDSLILRALLWKHGLAFPFGLVAPLALPGLALFWRHPSGQTPRGRLVLLFLVAYLLALVLFSTNAGQRLPLALLSLLFAGYGLTNLRSSDHWKMPALLFPLLLVLTNLRVAPTGMVGEVEQHFWLGQAYEQKGMEANAIREYCAVLERQPDHEQALLRLASLYRDQKQYSRAIKIYHTFLSFHPESVPARFLLGNTYVEVQRYEDAISLFEELTSLQPQWAALWGGLGRTYAMAGQLERAVQAYRQVLAINPDSSLVRYQLARIYQDQENVQAAIEEFGILLEEAPDKYDFHTRLADLLIKQEETGKETIRLEQTPVTRTAEEHLHQAIQLRPDYVDARWSMGLLLARQGRYAEAIAHFEKILELTPQVYQVHNCLGNLYKRTEKEEESRLHFATYARAERGQRLQRLGKAEFEQHVERVLKSMFR